MGYREQKTNYTGFAMTEIWGGSGGLSMSPTGSEIIGWNGVKFK
jgi:hypothetical protein